MRHALTLVRWCLTLAITILGLLLATFIIARVVPVDPVLAVVGERATPEVYEKTRHELGLDQPLYWQFWHYISTVATGNLGRSAMTSRPVLEDIRQFFPATLELATLATLLGVFIGVPLGIIAGVRQNSGIDSAIRVVGLVGHSLPVFVLGLLALLVFYAKLHWVAGPGRVSLEFDGTVPVRTGSLLIDAALDGDWGALKDALGHVLLPASVLAYFSLAFIARMTRGFIADEMRKEYVTTARAKGLSEPRLVLSHVLPNVAVGLVTVIVLSYTALLEGSVVTETIFAWPGLGQYLTISLLNADMNAVLGATLVVGAVYVLMNISSDALYHALDARVR